MALPETVPEGLPGAQLVGEGLQDLQAGNARTEGALLILMARTRLRAAGLDVPERPPGVDPERDLYLLLEEREPAGAYERYNALRRLLVSFCEALEHASRRAGARAAEAL